MADFDAQAAIILRHQQQHAVVLPGTAELPGIDHADRILLDGFGLRARQQQHCELATLLSFEGFKLRFEHLTLRGIER